MIRKRSGSPHTGSNSLAVNRLGVPSVVYFVLAGVAPLTVAAGVITTAYAVTGLTGVPAAFLIVAAVLGVFSVGFVAMARYIRNSGAFYAFVTRGLGRPAGVSAALVALVAYNLLQVGLYGGIGSSAADLAADDFHIHAAWWFWALVAWALVTVLGLLRVDLSGRILGVLLSLELVVVIALSVSGLLKPAGGRLSLVSASPFSLSAAGLGAVLAIAVLGYAGFEQSPLFIEEAKNPQRTVPRATYVALGLIAVVYAGVSWALVVAYGPGDVVGVARQQGPAMLFSLGGGVLPHLGRVLFLTSLFAAALAFHNAVWRYMFSLGRERVLPASLGRTGRAGVPKNASAVQSAVGLVFIVVFAAEHWDPMVKLFFWCGTTGGFGILLLLAATSIAVIRFFVREENNEPAWRRIIAPGVATVALIAMVWACLDNYSALVGVPAGSLSAKLLPSLYGVAVVLGLVWALILKARRPRVYAVIGNGADTAFDRRATPVAVSAGSLAVPAAGPAESGEPAR